MNRGWIFETSTEKGLLIYAEGEEILYFKEIPAGYQQSTYLMEVFEKAHKRFGIGHVPNYIGVGVGPGSHTGLRVGVSVAKAWAYLYQCPLIGVCSLETFAPKEEVEKYAVLVDARMGGIYYLRSDQGEVHKVSLQDLPNRLEGVELLLSPHVEQIKKRLLENTERWIWEEVEPSGKKFLKKILEKIERKECSNGSELFLYY